jgi:hypothetical protein
MSTGAAEPYVTDESIYSMSPQDFPALVPRSNIWGYGADGTIAAADPWTLHSDQNDFASMDIRPGMLVRFLAPKTIYGSTGEIYAVDAVGVASDREITVRRIGAVARAGEPPGDDVDLSGITFDILTLRPQIEQASSQIDARLAIGYATDRGRADLSPATRDQIRTLCAFMVLRDQYLAMAASMNEIGAGKSTFSAKSNEYADRVDTLTRTIRVVFVQDMESVNRRRVAWTFRI